MSGTPDVKTPHWKDYEERMDNASNQDERNYARSLYDVESKKASMTERKAAKVARDKRAAKLEEDHRKQIATTQKLQEDHRELQEDHRKQIAATLDLIQNLRKHEEADRQAELKEKKDDEELGELVNKATTAKKRMSERKQGRFADFSRQSLGGSEADLGGLTSQFNEAVASPVRTKPIKKWRPEEGLDVRQWSALQLAGYLQKLREEGHDLVSKELIDLLLQYEKKLTGVATPPAQSANVTRLDDLEEDGEKANSDDETKAVEKAAGKAAEEERKSCLSLYLFSTCTNSLNFLILNVFLCDFHSHRDQELVLCSASYKDDCFLRLRRHRQLSCLLGPH
ncbi:MAG: hypothetical protein SGARI_001240 [Bacillariaceae sp.]